MSNSRPIIELNPKFMFPSALDGFDDLSAIGLIFDCPACEPDQPHKIRVRFMNHPTADTKWDYSGNSFEDITITPSIDGTEGGACKFHGWVKAGTVSW